MSENQQNEVGVIKVSGRYQYDRGKPFRYVNMLLEDQVLDEAEGEMVMRATPKGARNLRATIGENPRTVVLELHHYNTKTGNIWESTEVKIYGKEIGMLQEFLEVATKLDFRNSAKVQFEPGAVTSRPDILTPEQVRKIDPQIVREFLRNDVSLGDVRAIASWRKALGVFEKLLNDEDYWVKAVEGQSRKSAEGVWQDFFERNQWIFGYGLSYIFTEGIDPEKLEQAIVGGTIFESGQRPDGVLKTAGAVSALCLVEIKTHKTDLVRDAGRGKFTISHQVSDAVSQCQKAVDIAERRFTDAFVASDEAGFATSDPIFSCRPRSILVIGHQGELVRQGRVARERYRSFEMYRRNLISPEIITFDELYERARWIVEYESKRN